MRGDDTFKRGACGDDDTTPEDRTCPDLTPATGRDNIPMFWESIGMKPGDDWKNEAGSDPLGNVQEGVGEDCKDGGKG